MFASRLWKGRTIALGRARIKREETDNLIKRRQEDIAANILIIDDDEMLCDTLHRLLEDTGPGYRITCAFTLKDGIQEALSGNFDVIFLDVRMPDGNGLDILPIIQELPFPPEVIIMTGAGDPDEAELAIKSGAWDYIEKPASIEEMTLPLVRALQYRREKVRKPSMVLKRDGIVGNSPQIKACLDLLAQAASSNASVLITGETGSGKELFAQAIHYNSRRASKNFVVVDCAVLPETLVENILFGHEKGAFTGADKARDGLIKQADGGTVFLDEVGDLPLPVQKAFLRVLQEHRFRPLGSKQETICDFRLVTATHRDLDSMVQRGQFRQDLLFRLRGLSIELPSLRERPEDIQKLTMYHVARLCGRYGIGTKGFSQEFLDVMAAYQWPGNIRELINTLESALAGAQHSPTLFPKHLPTYVRTQVARTLIGKHLSAKRSPGGNAGPGTGLPKLQECRAAVIAEAERLYLQDLISYTGSNIKQACQVSGLSRPRLYALLKKYKTSREGDESQTLLPSGQYPIEHEA